MNQSPLENVLSKYMATLLSVFMSGQKKGQKRYFGQINPWNNTKTGSQLATLVHIGVEKLKSHKKLNFK